MDLSLHIRTFKEGLLARLAHDLQLSLIRCEVKVSGREVQAWFDLRSLRVDGAVSGGALDLQRLSARDRQQIEALIVSDVLPGAAGARATYSGRLAGDGPGYSLQGTLTLMGTALPVGIGLSPVHGTLRGEVELTPSRWGIKPFHAMAGALKVQDRVRVTLVADAAALPETGVLAAGCSYLWTCSPAGASRA